ncbi:hypothetical protein K523DRAFT_318574 [Schizophyllum commune Tattone D]|nr:hypothetical protein K523DRAFT_318574 [Schizophyllum commune Tattone D]
MQRLDDVQLERLVSSFTNEGAEFRAPLRIPTAAARHAAPLWSKILNIHPENEREAAMHSAILELERDNETYRRLLMESQAVNILNQLYNAQLKEKLAHRDQKSKQAKVKGRLMGDGLPVILTSDEFYRRVVEYDEQQSRKVAVQEARKTSRADYHVALAEYKRVREAQLKEYEVRRKEWEKELDEWEAEKVRFAADKRAGKVKGKFTKEKPKCGRPPRAPPRPKLADFAKDQEESEGEVFEQVSGGETSSEDE